MTTKHYDLAVYNGSPAGIACAVRAAREGLSVLMVNHTPILGGMISNGLCVWDTQYEGKRSPIYDELRQAMFDYYRDTYGEDSDQYRDALPQASGHSNGNFEPKVAQMLVEKMVGSESLIDLLLLHYPAEAVCEGRMVKRVIFGEMGHDGLPKEGGARVAVSAGAWADCSYEGDLMAVCGAPYCFGRESRDKFDEPHAGRIFVKPSKELPSERLAFLGREHDRLNLRRFPGFQEIIETAGSGEGEDRVQAFNLETFPGQIPYRAILPPDLDNLLVPLCVSSSHVGWSTIRLEPTWMNIGEAAAWAIVEAAKTGVMPAEVDTEKLLQKLADSRVMISFFNDVDLGSDEGWIPAVAYLATKGFFPGYNARAMEALDEGTANVWAAAGGAIVGDESRSSVETAATTMKAQGGAHISPAEFAGRIGAHQASNSSEDPITRGATCLMMYNMMKTANA